MKLSKYFYLFLLVFSSCTTSSSNYCITAFDCDDGQICVGGFCVDKEGGDTGNSGNSGNTGNSGDTGNSGNTGNSGDSGNTGNTGNSGNSGNSGNTGNTGNTGDVDEVADIDNVEPFCGNELKEDGEECDNGVNNVDKTSIIYCDYGQKEPCYPCTTECVLIEGINSFCGNGTVELTTAVFEDGAVFFNFDEGSDLIVTDSSGKNNNGTVSDADWVDGKFGKALSFKGTVESYVGVSYAPPINNFTMMAWVKASEEHEIDPQENDTTAGISGQKYIFDANNKDTESGAGVSVGTNGVSVYEHGNAYMPALAVYNGYIGIEWTHIAVVYSEKQPSVFVNGSLVVTGLVSPKDAVHAPTRIGSGGYGYFNGLIDEVKIFSKALTENEIIAARGEVCDDGVNNVEPGYQFSRTCNVNCTVNSFCGDGILNSGETCDDGILNGTSGKCKADCSGYDCVPGTFTFEYTGAQQSLTVPGPGTYSIEVWGGQGRNNHEGNVAGGLGGYAKANVPLTTGDTLYIYVGEGGGSGTAACWNGGGAGGTSGCVNAQGGAGGGASDVRKNGAALGNRVLVAGGGGGAGGNRIKGCGPGTGGGGGGGYFGGGGGASWTVNSVATGGTQTSGGAGGTVSSGGLPDLSGTPGESGSSGQGGAGGAFPGNNQTGGKTAAGGGAGGGTTGNNGINAGDYTGGSGGGGSGYVDAAGNTNGAMSNGARTGNGTVVITRTCP